MANNALLDRILKNSTIKETSILDESIIFQKGIEIATPVPAINVALSGKVNGGLSAGLTMLAGESKHFKSSYMLLMASAFLKKEPDGIVLFYVSEFGTPKSMFTSFGIPGDRVIATPITDVEQLKFDIMQQIGGFTRKDKVMIMIDSIGNLASKKEVDDAVNQKSVADMTRAKQIKSLFRMVTPHLSLKDIPMVVINHIYKTTDMYPTDVVSGGTGIYLSADNIWIIGRQKEKDADKTVTGYNFVIKIEKSRHVREGMKIPINVSFKEGITKWSAMLDMSVDAKILFKGKKGNRTAYYPIDQSTGEVDESTWHYEGDIENSSEFWMNIFSTTKFAKWIETNYRLSQADIIKKDDQAVVFIPDQDDDEIATYDEDTE